MTATIGVSILVPEPWGSRLREARLGYGDAQAETVPTHITLVPPTPVPAKELTHVHAALQEAGEAFPPFEVKLRGTGTFRPLSDVVFIQVAQGVAMCERLHRALLTGHLDIDLRFPYHPHVTVAQDVPAQALDQAFDDLKDFECEFQVDKFDLYIHGSDDRWRPFREYPLCGTVVDPDASA